MFFIGQLKIDNQVCVAPMAGITDLPYRLILKEYGAGLLTTELISAKAICFENKKTDIIAMTSDEEKPVALQIFGSDSDIMARAAYLTIDKYDILDINMGCPVLKVVRNGEGSALMKEPKKAYEIVKKVVKVLENKKPVTCKIRIGYDSNNINAVEFAKVLEDAGASAITIHGRTRVEMYSGKVHIDIIKKVVDSVKIPVIANGNIFSAEDAKNMLDLTGAKAIALGRGVKGNPWLVSECISFLNSGMKPKRPSVDDIKNVMLELVKREIEYRGEKSAISELKHHICWFTSGIKNSSKFRTRVNNVNNKMQLFEVINNYFDNI